MNSLSSTLQQRRKGYEENISELYRFAKELDGDFIFSSSTPAAFGVVNNGPSSNSDSVFDMADF